MQVFPHRYSVTARARVSGEVSVESQRLPTLSTLPPAEFDGPGDRWSPETLFIAALADCYVLTFRAVAAVVKLPWTSLTCAVDGTVERVNRVTQFTGFVLRARLEVPLDTDAAEAYRLLTRAKHACLVTNSLKADAVLIPHVMVTVEGAA